MLRLCSYRLAIGGLLLTPLLSLAQSPEEKPVEEVRVTGDLLQRTTLETVSSITVIPEAQIEARSIRDLYDLLLRTPNVSAAKEDKFSVRGISNEGIGPGGAGRPTVSVFIDGARQPGRGVGNTWDIEQVEFYRGPQSTAFGPGSLAGAIVLKTKSPSFEEYDAKLKLGVANDNGREAGVALGGPIGGGFAFRYAAETNQTDGEVTNTTLNDDEWQARDRYLQRFKLAWAGSDWYSAELSYQQTKLREGNEYLPPESAESNISTDNIDGYYDDDSELIILKQTAFINEQLQLQFIASQSESENERKGDYDVSPEDRGFFINTTKLEHKALELRLSFNNDWISSVVGVYSSDDDLNGDSVNKDVPYSVSGINLLADALLIADRSAETKALYAETDIDLSSRLTLTVGGRYEENDADNRSAFIVTGAREANTGTDLTPLVKPALDSDISAPSGDKVFLPKTALSYDFNDQLNGFVSYTQGYRAGSVDFVSNGNSPTYDPEYTDNYDIGLKLRQGSWFLQAALFRIDYEDMQVGVRVDTNNFRTDNAGEARAQGVELEFNGELGYGFSIFGGLGYTDTEFKNYSDDDVSYNGLRFPNAPLITGNLTLSYQHSSGVFADINWSRTDHSYTDRENSQNLMADARDIYGARLGWQNEQLRIELYGKNLTDEFYITDRFVSPSLGINAAFAGDPREYGLRVTYQY